MASSSHTWHWIMLLSLAAATWSSRGDPILGPDLSRCQPSQPGYANETISCCILNRSIVEFKLPEPDAAMRTRRAVHTLDEEYIGKYKKAYEIMRSLPAKDPRSFAAQADLHCAYSMSYKKLNSTDHFEIHDNYFFMPFHRWLVYFHERILGSLSGDDTFTLPYWAWDVQDDSANAYPSIFLDSNSSLFDLQRIPRQETINLNCDEDVSDVDEQKILNRYEMWRVMLGDVAIPEDFYGYKDEEVQKEGFAGVASGKLAYGPHKCVHRWVGAHMRRQYSSGRDPLIYSHHSQVDRLWLIYQEFGGPVFLNDRDWLDSEFLLYDENADLVRVRVKDSLDLEKLRVKYEQVPAEWIDYLLSGPNVLHNSS